MYFGIDKFKTSTALKFDTVSFDNVTNCELKNYSNVVNGEISFNTTTNKFNITATGDFAFVGLGPKYGFAVTKKATFTFRIYNTSLTPQALNSLGYVEK
jgi:hypothetical protein